MSEKRVVVVGGGIAGGHTAKYLEDYAKVTLVDPKEYFEVPYGLLRSIIEPEFGEKSVFYHSEYLFKAEVVIDSAKSASDKEVVTASGSHLPYDYLVLATGSTYQGPRNRLERVQYFMSENKKIKSAATVLIIGGGPVGVELAGEIVTDFPEKKVIIVHSGERLLEFLGSKASKKTLAWLQSKKVEVYLNERIDISGLTESTTTFTTSSGKAIKADTHFVAIGKRVGSDWIRGSAFENVLDSNGRLKVDKSLRVEGYSNVFAIGDIANTEEIKQGYLAQKHSQITADNIKKLIRNPNSKLSSYKPLATPMGAVSLGRKIGVAQLPFGTITGKMAGMIKSKHLFVAKTRQGLGVKDA